MKASNSIVSKEFRDLLGREYPGIHRNPAHWRMLDHLLFGMHRCRDTDNRLINQSILASIERKEALLEQRHYTAETYLRAFKEDVMPGFEWSGWDYESGECRTVTALPISEHVQAAVQCEVSQRSERSDLVYMADGLKPTPAKRRQQRETDQRQALAMIAHAGCEDAERLLYYLNNLPANRFTRLLDYLPATYDAARAIEDPAKRDHQLSVLKAIDRDAKPLYQPSKEHKTVRIFPFTSSMLMLRKGLRRIITQEWYEADLRSSQFAICAREWNVPLVEEFLRSGTPVWTYLYQHMQLDGNADNKAVLKTALYSLMFGKSKRNLRRDLLSKFGNETTVKLFFACPLIKAMLDARKRRTVEIERDGGATNVYGHWISAEEHNTRSILAQLAQATELKLLSPVINLAHEHSGPNGFTILLWQHDGFSWSPNLSRNGASWETRLKEAVSRQACEMGIETTLEVEPPISPPKPPQPKTTEQRRGQGREKRDRTRSYPFPDAQPSNPHEKGTAEFGLQNICKDLSQTNARSAPAP